MDVNEVPDGWNPNEPDLDDKYENNTSWSLRRLLTRVFSDIEGHIERAKERIQDGIMPQVFEGVLEEYQLKKTNRE